MPTLIRLVIVLAVLAGIAFGAMVAIVAVVTPREKDVTIRIPARDLVTSPERAPIVRREIDTTRPAAAPAAPAPAADSADDNGPTGDAPAGDDVVTIEQGVE